MVKYKLVGIGIVITAMSFCGFEIYLHDGIVGMTRKNGFGCLCHGFDPSPNVLVWISGPDSLSEGQQALYTISVAKDTNIASGFNVAALWGALGIVDSLDTQLLSPGLDSLELTHTQPKLRGQSDTITWSFFYRAPPIAGVSDTLYANANSVDMDFTTDGDFWNLADNFVVRIIGTVGVKDEPLARSFHVFQNYPNPFNPETVIRFELPSALHVRLSVFDIAGRAVRKLVDEEMDAGLHEVSFASQGGSTLASGIYFYRLEAGQNIGGGKMILLK